MVEAVVEHVCLYGWEVGIGEGNYNLAAKCVPTGMASEAEVR